MHAIDSRVRRVGAVWYYVDAGYTVFDGLTGKEIERVPEQLMPATDYREAVAMADYYDEQRRAQHTGYVESGCNLEAVFDGDW